MHWNFADVDKNNKNCKASLPPAPSKVTMQRIFRTPTATKLSGLNDQDDDDAYHDDDDEDDDDDDYDHDMMMRGKMIMSIMITKMKMRIWTHMFLSPERAWSCWGNLLSWLFFRNRSRS